MCATVAGAGQAAPLSGIWSIWSLPARSSEW